MASLQTGQVAVGTSATLLVTVENPVSDVLVSSTGAFSIGGAGVTTGTGLAIPASSPPVTVPVSAADPPFSIYAVASATTTVSYAYVA